MFKFGAVIQDVVRSVHLATLTQI